MKALRHTRPAQLPVIGLLDPGFITGDQDTGKLSNRTLHPAIVAATDPKAQDAQHLIGREFHATMPKPLLGANVQQGH
jgi:hypothetical protein